MTEKIPLHGKRGEGIYTLVDENMYEYLNQWRWHLRKSGHVASSMSRESANGKKEQRVVFLHRLVNKTPEILFTDHINGDKLDNRAKNLRSCTKRQNMQSFRKVWSKSGYRGVYESPKTVTNRPWMTAIMVNKKNIKIGYYSTKEQAAQAYNSAAQHYYGDFAALNRIN